MPTASRRSYDTRVKWPIPRWRSSLPGYALMVPLLLAAPVQCPAEQEPSRTRVEEPAEAVYQSALNLRALGYAQAEEETLRYLIAQYPGSRWAERARLDLRDRAEPRP